MENNKRPKQASKIIRYMQANGSITQLQALRDLGCLRLASRISELKKDGYEINKRMIKVKNSAGEPCYVAEYSLDVNGSYEPSNCRWATIKEQANNKKTRRTQC